MRKKIENKILLLSGKNIEIMGINISLKGKLKAIEKLKKSSI